jgi:hypothetical protein
LMLQCSVHICICIGELNVQSTFLLQFSLLLASHRRLVLLTVLLFSSFGGAFMCTSLWGTS